MRPMLLLLLLPLSAVASDCRLGGEPINTDNGSTYAGKSGRILCYDEAGALISEEEVRNGEIFGYERRKGFDGGWRERTTNANRNTHGVAKEFWPDGTLKSEATYDDGEIVGASRRFHENGKLARVDHSGGAALEFDDAGRLKSLRCAGTSLLPEDRKPCGFAAAEATTELHRNGRIAERVTYRDGKLLRHETVDAGRAVTASSQLEGGAEVRRTFHPDGRPATELRVVDGWHVEERAWFMNGQLKTHTVREPVERTGKVETTTWRDDGTLAARELFAGRARLSTTRFDKAGRQQQIEDYASEGHLARRRTFGPDGTLASDESYHPDGSRR